MKPGRIACCIVLGSAVVAAAPLLAAENHTRSNRAAKVQHRTSPQTHNAEDAGQRVFDQNCGRCHNPPDGFSPRITGTIVRHMRVRANLSRHDEEVLLHYFNP